MGFIRFFNLCLTLEILLFVAGVVLFASLGQNCVLAFSLIYGITFLLPVAGALYSFNIITLVIQKKIMHKHIDKEAVSYAVTYPLTLILFMVVVFSVLRMFRLGVQCVS